MIAAGHRAYLLSFLAGASLVTATATAAFAADASAWDDDLQSSARLIAAPLLNTRDGPVFRAAVQIKLKSGWKTYWRYPGDTGVPPVLDFSRSQNVKAVNVLYPAPTRFADGAGGHSIGYGGDVIWPLHIAPADPAKPVKLNLKLDYAACERLCVPAKAELELLVGPDTRANDAVVRAAEARVPKAAAIGDPGTPSIQAVRREAVSGRPRVAVDVAADAPVTLFAEGPTPQWSLPLPEPVSGAPAGLQRFAFELDGVPPGQSARGATLRLTAVSGDKAIEVAFRLD